MAVAGKVKLHIGLVVRKCECLVMVQITRNKKRIDDGSDYDRRRKNNDGGGRENCRINGKEKCK